MFVDACAIVSIMSQEGDAEEYAAAIEANPHSFTSAMAAWEACVILARKDKFDISFEQAGELVCAWLGERGIELRDSKQTAEVIVKAALDAASRYGSSRRKLSSFDCFHYAYARAEGMPLLTRDSILRQTDVPTFPE